MTEIDYKNTTDFEITVTVKLPSHEITDLQAFMNEQNIDKGCDAWNHFAVPGEVWTLRHFPGGDSNWLCGPYNDQQEAVRTDSDEMLNAPEGGDGRRLMAVVTCVGPEPVYNRLSFIDDAYTAYTGFVDLYGRQPKNADEILQYFYTWRS